MAKEVGWATMKAVATALVRAGVITDANMASRVVITVDSKEATTVEVTEFVHPGAVGYAMEEITKKYDLVLRKEEDDGEGNRPR